MGRALIIVGLVGLMVATGVAVAAPVDQVRVPVTVVSGTTPSPGTAESVVVRKGDHLWKISERHLGEEATDEEVAPYWVEVIDVNTPHLKSGDPDLIYPGEVVRLP